MAFWDAGLGGHASTGSDGVLWLSRSLVCASVGRRRDHGVGRGVGPRRAASLEVSIATEHAATRERETVGEDLNDCGGDAGDNDEPGGDARGP